MDWMLRSIVVVSAGRSVVPTICYGTGGEERMDGDQRCEEGCSCAPSPPGCRMERTALVMDERSSVMLEWSASGFGKSY